MSGHFSPADRCWEGGWGVEWMSPGGSQGDWDWLSEISLLEGVRMFRYSSLGNGVRATSRLYKLCAPVLSDLKFLRPQRGQLGVRCWKSSNYSFARHAWLLHSTHYYLLAPPLWKAGKLFTHPYSYELQWVWLSKAGDRQWQRWGVWAKIGHEIKASKGVIRRRPGKRQCWLQSLPPACRTCLIQIHNNCFYSTSRRDASRGTND